MAIYERGREAKIGTYKTQNNRHGRPQGMISLAGQHVRPPSENYFEPWPSENAQFGTFRLLVRRADHSVTLPPWIECNN